MSDLDETMRVDVLTPGEVQETRWLLSGVRPLRPFLASIAISWKFCRWIAGELKWIAALVLLTAAIFKGEILTYLSTL